MAFNVIARREIPRHCHCEPCKAGRSNRAGSGQAPRSQRLLRAVHLLEALAMTGLGLLFASSAYAEDPSKISPLSIPGFSIHGENSFAAEMHGTGGSGDKTLLRRGGFLTDGLKLKIDQALPGGWASHTDLHARKTQDPQIDRRRDVHLLGLTTELYNPKAKLTFGDFFGDFSQYTLGQSLEGFQAAYKTGRIEAKGVVGISQHADETRQFRRTVYGGRSEALLFEKYKMLKDARFGFNLAGSEDDKGSIENKNNVAAASNRVGSLNSHIEFFGKSTFDSEVARSWTDEDTRSDLVTIRTGTALRVNNQTQWTKKAKTKLLYEWVMPDFNTLTGSAVPDRVSFTSRANYKLNSFWAADSGYRVQYNKLAKSAAAKKTQLHVPNASISWTPASEDWLLKDFFSRLFWEQRRRFSDDDSSGQIDFVSNEVGLEDEFKVKKYNLSSGWTIRDETDDFQKANNRLTNDAYLGVRTYRSFWGMDAVPSARWLLNYDGHHKEGGRDLRHTAIAGLDLDFKHGLKLEQKYSLGANRRHQEDSDSLKFDAFVGLEYQIPHFKGTTLKVSYTTTDYAHHMSTQSFSEHNLRAELLCKF